MIRAIFALALLLPATALAKDTVEVTNPLGKTIQAEKITDPEPGTLEYTALTSIEMMRDGKFDEWMNSWCHPTRCPDDPNARASLKRYNLTAASKTGAGCLHDGGKSLIVTRRVDDAPDKKTIYLFCGETRMPAPSTYIKQGDKWLVSSFSW